MVKFVLSMHPSGGDVFHHRMVSFADLDLEGMPGTMPGSTGDTGDIGFVL